MRYLISLFVALCLSGDMLCAEEPLKLSPAEQEVVQASKARGEAFNKRDSATWARYVADDCVFSSDDGDLMTKGQMLENLKKRPPAYDQGVDARDYVVRIHGDTAVINYRITVHEQFGDTDIITEQRHTETNVKQNGSWLLIAEQWDNLPVNFRKPVAVDPKIFADYVGQYEWRQGDDVETVFLKDGKLWSQLGQDLDEYLPAGVDTFFLKDGDLGTFVFSRDAQGRVIGCTYHRIDGQEIHVKKIK